MTAEALIKNALARGFKAGTVLQDAVDKVRKARRKSDTEFDIALGELFVLSSDAFRKRNGYKNQLDEANKTIGELQEQLERFKQNGSSSHVPIRNSQ